MVVDNGGEPIVAESAKTRLLAELALRTPVPGRRRIVLRFATAPIRILGEDHVSGVEVTRTRLISRDGRTEAVPTGETEVIEAGMVLRSVGYRATAIAGLPFDERTSTVPHENGRVRPGTYVAGWIKRGPSGFIGTNKACSEETVTAFLDDLESGRLQAPTRTSADLDVALAGVEVVDLEGWRALDRAEVARGAAVGRPRVKLLDPDEIVRIATLEGPARRRGRVRRTSGPRRVLRLTV